MSRGIRRAVGRTTRRPVPVLVAVTVVLATVLLTAATASAHSSLVASTPAEGRRLDQAPRLVTLTFDDEIRDDDVNQVAVTGPDGTQWASGVVRVAGAVVTTRMRGSGPAGEYTIGYRVVSADGDPVAGEITYRLLSRGAGTGAQAPVVPPASDAEPSGLPLSLWLVGALAVLAIGLAVTLRAAQRWGRPV